MRRHRTRQRCRALVGAVLGLVIMVPIPAAPRAHATVDALASRPPGSATSLLSPSAQQTLTSAQARADSLRAGQQSLHDTVLALAAARDVRLDAVGSVPPPDPTVVAALADVDQATAVGIAGIAATTQQIAASLGNLSARELSGILESFEQSIVPAPTPSGSSVAPRHPTSDARTTRATVLLARALDEYLPLISDIGAGAVKQRAGELVEGCDVLDQAPLLCVGSDADNVYESDRILLIDLGGDDVYRNGAGASPVALPGGQYSKLSVNIDAEGDDRYDYDRGLDGLSAPGWSYTVAQGSGLTGIGMLVDVAGDDVYRVSAPAPDAKQRLHSVTLGQASAAVNAGFGGLFDLGGDDSYSLSVTDGADGFTGFVAGQGAGTSCRATGAADETAGAASVTVSCNPGLGAVLSDRGGGGDEYLIDGGALELTPEFATGFATDGGGYLPSRLLIGQGGGQGALVDDGGSDAFDVRGAATNPYPHRMPDDGAPVVAAYVQGSGFSISRGLLVTGPGSTTYRVSNDLQGLMLWSQVHAQGAAGGALSDLGGDDRYAIDAGIRHHSDVSVRDVCGCQQARLTADSWPAFGLSIAGQGASEGILDDAAGDDVYEVGVRRARSVRLLDQLSAPSAPPRVTVLDVSLDLLAQGAGDSNAAGVLLDRGGADTYEVRSFNEVAAEATSEQAAGVPSAVAYNGHPTAIRAQGGFGALLDEGGVRDRFAVRSDLSVSTLPDADGAFERSWDHATFVHGSGEHGLLVGLADVVDVSSTRPRDVCGPAAPAHRGYGLWAGCGSLGDIVPAPDAASAFWARLNGQTDDGLGYTTAQPTGAAELVFLPDTPAQADSNGAVEPLPSVARLPAEAQLRLNGEPLANTDVHFAVQHRTQPTLPGADYLAEGHKHEYPRWTSIWVATATTDADGVARAELPLVKTDESAGDEGALWRVHAVFDGLSDGAGEVAIPPAYAAVPLELR